MDRLANRLGINNQYVDRLIAQAYLQSGNQLQRLAPTIFDRMLALNQQIDIAASRPIIGSGTEQENGRIGTEYFADGIPDRPLRITG